MDRQYEFFVTTNEPHQPVGVERGLIRRLVMRNFFDTKWAGPKNNASEHNSASAVMAQRQLRSRFRLAEAGEGRRATKCRGRMSKEEEQRQGYSRVKEKPAGADDEMSTTNSPKESPTKLGDSYKERRQNDRKAENMGLVLKINPSSHRFDPFNVLPVPGTPGLDFLFQLCESHRLRPRHARTLGMLREEVYPNDEYMQTKAAPKQTRLSSMQSILGGLSSRTIQAYFMPL